MAAQRRVSIKIGEHDYERARRISEETGLTLTEAIGASTELWPAAPKARREDVARRRIRSRRGTRAGHDAQ